MFSIVIPLYNKEKQIANTIKSVQSQTFQDYEIIIVNDGSTDNSVEIVKQIDDKRIKLINQKNGGVSSARNTGIKSASFEYISFLDADDFWDKDYLETVFELIQKYPKCSVYALNFKYFFDEKFYRIPIRNGFPNNFKDGIIKNYFEIASKSDPILWSSAVTVKREAILSIDGFPFGIRAGEDLVTWAKLAAHFDIAFSIISKAYFVKETNIQDNTPRIPDDNDYVSNELMKILLEQNKNKIVGIKDYIAYWHKIRVSIFLRLNLEKNAKNEFKKYSMYSKKLTIRYWIYFVLVFTPKIIKKPLLKLVMFFKMKRS